MSTVKFRDNKSGRIYEKSMKEFEREDNSVAEALSRFIENEMQELKEKYTNSDGEISDGFYEKAEEIFYTNFIENFNRYSESWTSPRGVEPVYEILKIKESEIEND